ncbi:MAG: hypothetical protein IT340_23210 [Chloroflexi bacterium]|nr:hypothetical protein [Chloroflexota bacterium]
MDVVEGLERVRERLVANQARTETLDVVDEFVERARSAPGAQARSLGQLVQMLMRTQAAHRSTAVYDDLTRVEQDLAEAGARIQAERAALESRPTPKPTKYYKELKKKEREKGK